MSMYLGMSYVRVCVFGHGCVFGYKCVFVLVCVFVYGCYMGMSEYIWV